MKLLTSLSVSVIAMDAWVPYEHEDEMLGE